VAQQLIREGYQKVYALKGGFQEWEEANFPMEDKSVRNIVI
jgi:rhodanese-related sulfurtransferase